MKYNAIKIFLLLFITLPITAQGEDRLKVLSTLPSFASLVADIGGEYVDSSSIAPARFNPHFIEPKPSDVLKLKRTDLFVHSGLDLEAWRGPLVDASANPRIRPKGERELDLSTGVSILNAPTAAITRAEGDVHMFGNPHYWHNPENLVAMAATIETKLSQILPEHQDYFKANKANYITKLMTVKASLEKKFLPFQGYEVLGYHDEWIYLMRFLGMSMQEFLEPKPGIPPTAKHIQELEEWIRAKKITAIIQATFYPTDAAEALHNSTGAKVLLICQNVGELPECSDTIKMLEYNATTILSALQP